MKLPFEVRYTEKGRSLFATQFIRQGDIICICPLLKFSDIDNRLVAQTLLQHYIFYIDGNTTAIPLGYGLLFNHDDQCNVEWETRDNEFDFIAIRDVQPGEELTIDYGYEPDKWEDTDMAPLLTPDRLKVRLRETGPYTESSNPILANAQRRLSIVTAGLEDDEFLMLKAIRDWAQSYKKPFTKQQLIKAINIDEETMPMFDSAVKQLIADDYLTLEGNKYVWVD